MTPESSIKVTGIKGMITTLRLKLLIVKQTPAFQHLREGIENSKENMIAKGLVIIYVEAGWGRGKGERVQAISDWLEGGGGLFNFLQRSLEVMLNWAIIVNLIVFFPFLQLSDFFFNV